MEKRSVQATFLALMAAALLIGGCGKKELSQDERMAWWRDARFGMFIHWGLYAIPAGEWNGQVNHAEWIRTTAQIPLEKYDTFLSRFDPVKFDADAWVKAAKDAGMKYIVITSKHHDGFCLFDSKYTDFDVMSTPFKRDIMAEMARACRKQGLKICWYYSIMDWHHPDYLPRRGWEKDRSSEGADFSRYIQYMKNELRELLTNYGDIGVLWFDGEWESTWTREYGFDLYQYVRSLQPDIIINNRVGAGRSGMEGMNKEGEFAGDFGTPEQQIPATGLPGVDWETCMTMNDHWGWNKHDKNWKSSEDLIRKLVDIASKGGNFLLNVGPRPDGTLPPESLERLAAMGRWMKVNGEAIYGTQASPFKKLAWGRCTQKRMGDNSRLFLHIFDWPADGRLALSGIYNDPLDAKMLADPQNSLTVQRDEDALIITLPNQPPDTICSVVALDIKGKPDVSNPPVIEADFSTVVSSLQVRLVSDRDNVTIRYTLDGSDPSAESPVADAPITVKESTTVAARCFRDGRPVSGTVSRRFMKVNPLPAQQISLPQPGLQYLYYEGNWDKLPNFRRLSPAKSGVSHIFTLPPEVRDEYFGVVLEGYIQVDETAVYAFYTDSDDGSQLFIDGHLVVDNDGLHGLHEQEGTIALAKGLHNIRVEYFEKTGGNDLTVSWRSGSFDKQEISGEVLFY